MGKCVAGETCENCPVDCGKCSTCGDGVCNASQGETCFSCPVDCGLCPTCGNGVCDPTRPARAAPRTAASAPVAATASAPRREDCASCPEDCGVCAKCGDGVCTAPLENCYTCPADCGVCMGCGDGLCNDNKTCASCQQDCGLCSVCGDGKCQTGETCVNCEVDCGPCPTNETCLEVITCVLGNIGLGGGGLPSFNLVAISDCIAEGCANAQFFANQVVTCAEDNAIACIGGGGGGILDCLMTKCSSQFAACLGSDCN